MRLIGPFPTLAVVDPLLWSLNSHVAVDSRIRRILGSPRDRSFRGAWHTAVVGGPAAAAAFAIAKADRVATPFPEASAVHGRIPMASCDPWPKELTERPESD
jgi:hypothetical protein